MNDPRAVTEYLFVYGTLLSEAGHPMHGQLRRYCQFHGRGHMRGLLYEVAGYPGAIPSPQATHRVHGEVYRMIDAEVLTLLDVYEDCAAHHPEPHLYRRRPVTVMLAQSGSLSAWTYLYNRDISTLELIPSGDYLAYRSAKNRR